MSTMSGVFIWFFINSGWRWVWFSTTLCFCFTRGLQLLLLPLVLAAIMCNGVLFILILTRCNKTMTVREANQIMSTNNIEIKYWGKLSVKQCLDQYKFKAAAVTTMFEICDYFTSWENMIKQKSNLKVQFIVFILPKTIIHHIGYFDRLGNLQLDILWYWSRKIILLIKN